MALEALRVQYSTTEAQLLALQRQVKETEDRLASLKQHLHRSEQIHPKDVHEHNAKKLDDVRSSRRSVKYSFSAEEYKRYGRQMILPQIGARGQNALKQARVLIVGVGGLGCPAAAYLAGAGVGTIGLIDGDTVEVSNLHRQIAHSTDKVGFNKVASAHAYLNSLNPLVKYAQHAKHLTPELAIELFERYDLVLDCTDHPTSRYLISDACVLTGRPLVSASALKTEGQLIVLNNPARPPGDLSGGPCYRCIFPQPPPADTVVSCGEGGILGPVVGTMGIMQALEAIKVITIASDQNGGSIGSDQQPKQSPKTSMLILSAYDDPQFRTIKMRSRRLLCAACSAKSWITRESLSSGSMDYVTFCGGTVQTQILPEAQRKSVHKLESEGFVPGSVIVDVRDETQFGMCSLLNSINIPWTGDVHSWQKVASSDAKIDTAKQVYFICRLGNDSQLAADALLKDKPALATKIWDVQGGFEAWRAQVDPDWPAY